jgi:uncharacterized membrane protein
VLRRQGDLLLGILLSLILIGLAVLGFLPSILQGILALPFVLIAPGNALICAIIPGSSLSRLERFLFAIGLSLAVVILSGLVLNITPWGLQSNSWLLLLSVITLVSSVIAMWRRWRIQSKESAPERFYLPPRQVLYFGMAIVVISSALILTLTPRSPNNIQGYTSLWILPGPVTQPDTLIVGIHSQEVEITHYSLQITYNGQLKQEWSDISLTPGILWEQSITVPAGQGLMEAVLYRIDNPGIVYRRVSITLNK